MRRVFDRSVDSGESSRFSDEPVAKATQILMFCSLDNPFADRRMLADAAEFVQKKDVAIFVAARAKDVVTFAAKSVWTYDRPVSPRTSTILPYFVNTLLATCCDVSKETAEVLNTASRSAAA